MLLRRSTSALEENNIRFKKHNIYRYIRKNHFTTLKVAIIPPRFNPASSTKLHVDFCGHGKQKRIISQSAH